MLAAARQNYSLYSDRFTDALYEEVQSRVALILRPTAGDLYRLIAQGLNPKQATAYWGEKYAGRGIDALKFIDHIPGGKVIHIVRDPRDVCVSEKHRLMREANLSADDLSFLLMAMDWKISGKIGLFLREQLGVDYHRVSYESLVSRPRRTVKLICRFLGLSFAPQMLDPPSFHDDDGKPWAANSSFERGVTSMRSNFRGRWKGRLDPRVVKFIEEYSGRSLRLYGYRRPGRFREFIARWVSDRSPPDDGPDLYSIVREQGLLYINDPAHKAYIPMRLDARFDFSACDPIYQPAAPVARPTIAA